MWTATAGVIGAVTTALLPHIYGPCLPAKVPLSPAQIAAIATPSVVLIKTAKGLGAGFVVDDKGRIATNLHVLDGATQATVVTNDGREFTDVDVMAASEISDLIVLQVKAKGLFPVLLGNSDTIKPGDHVVAIGHPLGLGNTVSDGLISGIRPMNRDLTVLQISVPISPGSSGGPLFNDRGEVIGIATMIITQGQNLNFALPINQIKSMLTNDHPTPLAVFTAGRKSRRKVPEHPVSLLRACPIESQARIHQDIQAAINIGAPLYNKGNIEACYRIYAATALELEHKLAGCAGPKTALRDGVNAAGSLSGWNAKAWAMRDAFDGVLDVIERNGKAAEPEPGHEHPLPRNIPHHTLAVLHGCSVDSLKRIAAEIEAAIASGASLYNEGQREACYRIYDGAIEAIAGGVTDCKAARRALMAGQRQAQRRTEVTDKAWALRDAFDGMLDVIARQLGSSPHQGSGEAAAPQAPP